MLTTGLCLLGFFFNCLGSSFLISIPLRDRQRQRGQSELLILPERNAVWYLWKSLFLGEKKGTGKCFCEIIRNDKTEVNLKIGSCEDFVLAEPFNNTSYNNFNNSK